MKHQDDEENVGVVGETKMATLVERLGKDMVGDTVEIGTTHPRLTFLRPVELLDGEWQSSHRTLK